MLFASDLDGTLLNRTHEPDEVIISGINKVLDKGHAFAICTGRGCQNLDEVNFNIEHDNIYTIADNGAIFYDGHKNIIHKNPVKKEAIKMMYDLFGQEVFFRFEAARQSYYTFSYDEAYKYNIDQKLFQSDLEYRMNFYTIRAKFDMSIDEILTEDIYKINCSIGDKELIKRLNDFINSHSDLYKNAPWGADFFDITDASVDKASAVKWLANYLDEDDIYVYGDSYNDIELMEEFEHSFCPSNAVDEVREKASKVLGDYDDYSVIKHILENI